MLKFIVGTCATEAPSVHSWQRGVNQLTPSLADVLSPVPNATDGPLRVSNGVGSRGVRIRGSTCNGHPICKTDPIFARALQIKGFIAIVPVN